MRPRSPVNCPGWPFLVNLMGHESMNPGRLERSRFAADASAHGNVLGGCRASRVAEKEDTSVNHLQAEVPPQPGTLRLASPRLRVSMVRKDLRLPGGDFRLEHCGLRSLPRPSDIHRITESQFVSAFATNAPVFFRGLKYGYFEILWRNPALSLDIHEQGPNQRLLGF